MLITEHYKKHTVKFKAKLECDCGHKFYRIYSSYYTLNPFNNVTSHEENRHIVMRDLLARKSLCPKCEKWLWPVKYSWGVPRYLTREEILKKIGDNK